MAAELAERKVQLVGVGMGTMGLQFWLDEKIFPGALFVDFENKVHGALKLSSAGVLDALRKKNRDAYSQAEKAGFKGEFTDVSIGLQMGGVFVVRDGEFVLEQPQEELAENGNIEAVMEFLKN